MLTVYEAIHNAQCWKASRELTLRLSVVQLRVCDYIGSLTKNRIQQTRNYSGKFLSVLCLHN